jgi:hypothetical protein
MYMRQLPHALRAIAWTTYVADCEWRVWREKERGAWMEREAGSLRPDRLVAEGLID